MHGNSRELMMGKDSVSISVLVKCSNVVRHFCCQNTGKKYVNHLVRAISVDKRNNLAVLCHFRYTERKDAHLHQVLDGDCACCKTDSSSSLQRCKTRFGMLSAIQFLEFGSRFKGNSMPD